MSKEAMLIFLAGMLRGLYYRLGEEPDPIAMHLLKQLGVDPKYLPKEAVVKTEQTTLKS